MMKRFFIAIVSLSAFPLIHGMWPSEYTTGPAEVFRSLPIHKAAIDGDVDTVCRILDVEPIMINLPDSFEVGLTPLHWAALKQHKNVIRVLIKRGADVDRGDYSEGRKPSDFPIVQEVQQEFAQEREYLRQAQLALLMASHARVGVGSPLQQVHQLLPQIARYLNQEHFE